MNRWAVVGFIGLVAVIGVVHATGAYPVKPEAFDLHAYWTTRDGFDYASHRAGENGAYLYSPAFAQVIQPLADPPWPAFAMVWTGLLSVPMLWLAGRFSLILALAPLIALSLVHGQLDILFATVSVVGFRWPAAWAIPLLTKVTPGIGLIWFAVRREWRSLGIAVAATGAIAFVSLAFDPIGWVGWFGLLRRQEFPALEGGLLFLPVHLWLRLPVAAALVAWGAATDRRWTVPVAVCLALPTVWLTSVAILVALVPLSGLGAHTPAGAWLRSAPAADRAPVRYGRAPRSPEVATPAG